MKSVGEVMAIGRKFEEVLQKALRMLEIGVSGLVANDDFQFDNLETELSEPTEERVFAIPAAIKQNFSIDKIHELSHIDKWFLYKIKNIVDIELELQAAGANLQSQLMQQAKQHGFSDTQIATATGSNEMAVRELRQKMDIRPFVRQIGHAGPRSIPPRQIICISRITALKMMLNFRKKTQ